MLLSANMMARANEYSIEPPAIYLHINSDGGGIFDGFAGMDAILKCKTPIVTVIDGCCASAGTFLSLLLIELWGKFADKYGSYNTIKISSILMIFLPMLWVINPNPIYLIFVPSALSGVAWAGFHIAENNFIYDNVGPQKRGLAITYYNLFLGAGIFLGGLISAMLTQYLNTTWIEPIILIFIIASILRFFVVAFGIRKLKEIRHTKEFKGIQSIGHLVLKEAKPTIQEEFRQVMHIGKYLKTK